MLKKILLSIIISSVFVYFILQKIDLRGLVEIQKNINYDELLIGFIILIFANVVRAKRFQIIDSQDLALTQWWIISQIYNMFTAMLPGGSGEALTAYMLKKAAFYKFGGAVRILFLTRIMDAASLAIIFLLSSSFISGIVLFRKTSIVLALTIFFLSLLLLLPRTEHFLIAILERIFSRDNKIGKFIFSQTDNFKNINSMKKYKRSYVKELFFSLVIILGAALSVYYVLHAFKVKFNLIQSFYCFGIYAFFQMVPVHGVAGIGTQAAYWSLALSSAGYSNNNCLALGVALHATFYIFIFFIGISAAIVWYLTVFFKQSTINLHKWKR